MIQTQPMLVVAVVQIEMGSQFERVAGLVLPLVSEWLKTVFRPDVSRVTEW